MSIKDNIYVDDTEVVDGWKKWSEEHDAQIRADERAKVLDLIDRHLWNYSKKVWADFQSVLEKLKEQKQLFYSEENYMNKENLIKRIDENYEDMIDAIHNNCAREVCGFDLIALFRDYTDEIIKIINEECV